MRIRRHAWIGLVALALLLALVALWLEARRWHVATVEVMVDGGCWRDQRESEERFRNYKGDISICYVELSMRFSYWRSERILQEAVKQYRTDNPSSTASDADVLRALREAQIVPVKGCKDSATISVRTLDAAFSVAVVNAYAQALVDDTIAESRICVEKALMQIRANVRKLRQAVEKMEKESVLPPDYAAKTNELAEALAVEAQGRIEVEHYSEFLVVKRWASVDSVR